MSSCEQLPASSSHSGSPERASQNLPTTSLKLAIFPASTTPQGIELRNVTRTAQKAPFVPYPLATQAQHPPHGVLEMITPPTRIHCPRVDSDPAPVGSQHKRCIRCDRARRAGKGRNRPLLFASAIPARALLSGVREKQPTFILLV